MDDSCNVCIEKYNFSTRSKVTCNICQYECCKKCLKRYITDTQSNHLFKCMKCGNEFNRTSLFDIFGKTFISKTYRDIRMNILFDIEKSYFPTTQDEIHVRLKLNSLRDQIPIIAAEIEEIRQEKKKEIYKLRECTDIMPIKDALDKYFLIQNEIENLDEIYLERKEHIDNQINDLHENESNAIVNTYLTVCPSKKCNGMISDRDKTEDGHYQCIICNNIICASCNIELTSKTAKDHKCDPDILESLLFIKKSSKPCPTCKARIHKIQGCNQMFCTHCHTSFDWKTLKINNGKIHNPHHAQWLLETQHISRESTDIVCGRELDMLEIGVKVYNAIMSCTNDKKYALKLEIISQYIYDAIRWGVHHSYETIPSLDENRHSYEVNRELRMSLLLNEINEDMFKSEIYKIDKSDAKRVEILNIVITFRDVLTELIWGYYEDANNKTLEQWIDLYNQITELETYINKCLRKVAEIFGSKINMNIMDDIRRV